MRNLELNNFEVMELTLDDLVNVVGGGGGRDVFWSIVASALYDGVKAIGQASLSAASKVRNNNQMTDAYVNNPYH